MKRGWVLESDIRKADSDEENMREAGWVEVITMDLYEDLMSRYVDMKIERDELASQHKSGEGK